MQAVILEFPSDSDVMSYSEKRFKNLEEKVESISTQRLSSAQESVLVPKTPWTTWTPLVTAVAALLVGIAGTATTLAIHFDNKIAAVNADVKSIDKRLTKLEDAVKTISSQQSDQTQKLVHDLLAVVNMNTQPARASQILTAAGSLVTTLANDKRPANPEFFQSGIAAIDQIDQEHGYLPAAFETRIKLAQYRSSIESVVPQWGTQLKANKMKNAFAIPYDRTDISLDGFEFDATLVSGNAVEVSGNRSLARNIVFEDGRFDGGTQTLDGIHWSNVYFVGTHIRYEGGEVELRNVRFINCTFESPVKIQRSLKAKDFIDYAALAQEELTISGE